LTDWPIATTYRDVGIHAGQSPRRIRLVKKQIDKVNAISDLMQLFEICGDPAWSPESRLLAGAKCTAGLRRAVERREPKPDIDPDLVVARTAGLGTADWAHPTRFCSLLDLHSERALPREEPLEE
jgi:hypothetical protein